MDKIDRSILRLLQNDARIANSDIAKELDIAASVVWDRIKKLEESKIIQKYCTVIDPEAINLSVLAFVTIKVNSANWSNKCTEQLAAIEDMEELHEVIGEDSYLAKLRVKDMNDLSEVLKKKISVIPEIRSTKTVIAINPIKENPYPNLNQLSK